MKLTTFILLSACITASATGNAQRVSISVKNASLETVFKEIKKQTGYQFLYNNQMLDGAKKVSIQLKDAALDEALQACFEGQPFTYEIDGKTIIIKPLEKKENTTDVSLSLSKTEVRPPIDVKGRILNENGEPVLASIQVKGTNKATTTNSDGYFELKDVNDNATLVITAVNIETREIKLNGRSELDVVSVKMKVESLNEVVINKGYYTERQKLTVGNVGKVTADQIEKEPVNNPLFALQGRVPGVTVTQTSGLPGAGVVVRVQGQNSLQNANGPLYVVDGVPISTEIPQGDYDIPSPLPKSGEAFIRQNSLGRGNTLNFLNTSDIESIEILKDADATAIYGSRAANGAVLITTKKGKAGKPSLTVDMQQGLGQVGHFMNLLNTPQYIEMRKEALKNDGLTPSLDPFNGGYAPDLLFWDTTRNTDWQKELIGGTAHYTNANASISGGSSEIQYLIGGNYHRETTVFPGNFSDQRGSMHLSLGNNNDLKRKFHFQISSDYSFDNNKLPRTDLTQMSLQLVPDAPALYDQDGGLNWNLNANGMSTFVNPLAALFYQTYNTKTNNLIANGNFSYDVLPGLKISTGLGFTNLQSSDIQTNSLLAQRPENRPNLVSEALFGEGKLNTWIIEPQLAYKKQFGKGRFDGLLGSSFQHTWREASALDGSGFNNDEVMKNPAAAASLVSVGFQRSIYKYDAIFSRLNYVYNDKYILNVTGRRDGSTRFGSNDKFHNFWSVGAGWIFSQEKLLGHQSFLNFGKVKGSYGTTGSDQIGDYRFLTLYNTINPQVPYQNTTGLVPGDIPNPYLQWEETKKLDLGLDLGLLHDRIFVTGNYARNTSSNQLISYYLPIITGRSSVLLNFPATIQNTNWEFTLSTENVKSKTFGWTTNINLTLPRNKLIKFPNLENTSYNGQYIIGQPVSFKQIYQSAGVDPTSGLYTFIDSHGNPTTTPSSANDRLNLFTAFPKYYGGFQNSFRFKGLQLDILFQFVKQRALLPEFGLGFAPGEFYDFNSSGNQPSEVMNRWQKPGDVANIQRFTAFSSNIDRSFTRAVASSKYYVDASYVRLKNLSLSWNLPSNWIQRIHLQNCRLFAEGQNLLTITNYKGLDPETPGYTTLPPLRVVTFGLQVKL